MNGGDNKNRRDEITMVRIRLRRVGSLNQPSYRIVAADKESPRDGKFLEVLGHYNPRTEPSTIQIDEARLFHWMKNGAQPSDSVVDALRSLGTWDRWERYKGGEKLEKLLKEAEAAIPEVDPRTRRDDLVEKRAAKKQKKEEKAEPEKPAKSKKETAKKKEDKAESEVDASEEAVEVEAEAETEEAVAEEDTQESEDTEEPEEPEEPSDE
jgi:small subunit ribosomal protein S16